MNQLIRCIPCNKLFFKTPFDQCPEYELPLDPPSGPLREIGHDDFQDFLKEHRGHALETLEIISDSFVSDRPYFEPVKVSYFKATNGKDRFVIKRYRERIDEPLTYQLIQGDYSLQLNRIEIQEEEIRKQLDWELGPSLIQETQREAFIELYRHILKTMEIHRLERAAEESLHPLEVFYKMDEVSLFYLLRNCRNIFKGESYRAIESFIERHKEDGVLLLKASYQIQLMEHPQSQAEGLAPGMAIEEKRALEKK
ncbi:MAG: hypothetical protein N3G78_14420 [Desulfobacterota bacterium]|nr:hypothetical protein [Thermodesulfobacteriota bacterium]